MALVVPSLELWFFDALKHTVSVFVWRAGLRNRYSTVTLHLCWPFPQSEWYVRLFGINSSFSVMYANKIPCGATKHAHAIRVTSLAWCCSPHIAEPRREQELPCVKTNTNQGQKRIVAGGLPPPVGFKFARLATNEFFSPAPRPNPLRTRLKYTQDINNDKFHVQTWVTSNTSLGVDVYFRSICEIKGGRTVQWTALMAGYRRYRYIENYWKLANSTTSGMPFRHTFYLKRQGICE